MSNQETLAANAIRRALKLGEEVAVPRVSDLDALAASTQGKVEIETLDEGRDGEVVERLVKTAVLIVFRDRVAPEKRFGPIIIWETTGLPYRYRHFAKMWRQVAKKAGVPDDV